MENNDHKLFNRIAPVYGLFYNFQRKKFSEILKTVSTALDITKYESILDIGCGTGALCSVVYDLGLNVVGVEPAIKMLSIAKLNNKKRSINFLQGDVLKGLPFKNGEFDVVISSYVAHGLTKEKRVKMYKEMSRIAKEWVVIYDYNENRGLLTSIVEYAERGDYFNFIKVAEEELRDCSNGDIPCFSEIKVIDVSKRGAWYICKASEGGVETYEG